MNTSKYELSVLINGPSGKKNITKLSHEGKFFIEAKDGTEYILKVSNSTAKRVMAIVSVDGVNVVDGTAASDKGTGYIVAPYSAVEIRGYRESETLVGAFKFTIKDKSYAKDTTGSAVNSGVIGCIIVEESNPISDEIKRLADEVERLKNAKTEHHHHHYPKVDPIPTWTTDFMFGATTSGPNDWMDVEYSRGPTKSTAGNVLRSMTLGGSGAQSYSANYLHVVNNDVKDQVPVSYTVTSSTVPVQEPVFDLGSTWGQKLYDKVEMVTFERGVIVDQSMIYYASREALIAMGVPVTLKKAVSFPTPFPGQFCVPPSN